MTTSVDAGAPTILRFERFTLDLQRRALYADGARLHLTPKPLETLTHLVERHGRVVTKEELFGAVWAETAVTDGTLVQAIREIRKTLGDDPDDPRFVQTVPRVGYRFIGRVTAGEANTVPAFVRGPSRFVRRRLAAWAAAIALIGSAGYGLYRLAAPSGPGPDAVVEAQRLPNAAAQQAYLRGRFFWNKRTLDGFQKAIEEFESALAADPNYVLPHLGLADTHILMGYSRFLPPSQAHAKARAAALTALEIDPTVAEAHVTIGRLKAIDWDWAGAERSFRRAIELNPRSAAARHWYANHLTNVGRHDDAITEARRAVELEPLSVVVNGGALGAAYLFAGRYDAAIEQYRRTLALEPNFASAHALLGMTYIRQRKPREAAEELRRALTLNDVAGWKAHLGYVQASLGNRREARRMLAELARRQPRVPSVILAAVHVALGETNLAFTLLERAYEAHEPELAEIRTHLVFECLGRDARFQGLLRRMNLPL